jgi:hypothetical protein
MANFVQRLFSGEKKHTWPPKERFVIVGDPEDRILKKRLEFIVDKYQIPPENIINFDESFEHSQPIYKNSRIDILAHGNYTQIAVKEGNKGIQELSAPSREQNLRPNSPKLKRPQEVADSLKKLGVTEVGVVRFYSCEVGNKKFLENFSRQAYSIDLKVGYATGYTGMIAPKTTTDIVKLHVPHNLRDRTGIRADFVNDFILRPLSRLAPIPAGLARETVKGGLDVNFPGTRYETKASIVQQQSSRQPSLER